MLLSRCIESVSVSTLRALFGGRVVCTPPRIPHRGDYRIHVIAGGCRGVNYIQYLTSNVNPGLLLMQGHNNALMLKSLESTKYMYHPPKVPDSLRRFYIPFVQEAPKGQTYKEGILK